MSSRAARAQRRARQRAIEREALRSVLAGADHGLAECIEPSCHDTGPVVAIGHVHVTLCPRHKRQFDERWRAAAAEPHSPAV